METCKWVKHIDEGCYSTECGKIQGIKIRPKQKICYCGKHIERINLNTLSEPMEELINSIKGRFYMAKEFLIDEHQEEILELEKELHELIDYDEWSARLYGENNVDYYWTAFNLLKAGYRKVTD